MEAELACCSPWVVPPQVIQGWNGESPSDRYRPAEDLMAESRATQQVALAEKGQYDGNPKQR